MIFLPEKGDIHLPGHGVDESNSYTAAAFAGSRIVPSFRILRKGRWVAGRQFFEGDALIGLRGLAGSRMTCRLKQSDRTRIELEAPR